MNKDYILMAGLVVAGLAIYKLRPEKIRVETNNTTPLPNAGVPGSKTNVAAAVGGSVGGVAVLGALGGVGYYYRKQIIEKIRGKQSEKEESLIQEKK